MRTSNRGFTLIELLIVVVIIGILSAIAIPKFASTKERAFLATMKSDLRNLVTAPGSLSQRQRDVLRRRDPQRGVPVSAQHRHDGHDGERRPWAAGRPARPTPGTAKTCAIFYGNAAVLAPATANGEPKCT